MAVTNFDIQSGVDRLFRIVGYGHLLGLPTRPGSSSTDVTGVPTNGIKGFAKSALFLNFKGSIGSYVYANTGTYASATWTNIL